jgi:hypothetical protein
MTHEINFKESKLLKQKIPKIHLPHIFNSASNCASFYEEGGTVIYIKHGAPKKPIAGYAKCIVHDDASPKKPKYVFPVKIFTHRTTHKKSMMFHTAVNDVIITVSFIEPNSSWKKDGFYRVNIFQISKIEISKHTKRSINDYVVLLSYTRNLTYAEDAEPIYGTLIIPDNTGPYKYTLRDEYAADLSKQLRYKKLSQYYDAVIKTFQKAITTETTYTFHRKSGLVDKFLAVRNKERSDNASL